MWKKVYNHDIVNVNDGVFTRERRCIHTWTTVYSHVNDSVCTRERRCVRTWTTVYSHVNDGVFVRERRCIHTWTTVYSHVNDDVFTRRTWRNVCKRKWSRRKRFWPSSRRYWVLLVIYLLSCLFFLRDFAVSLPRFHLLSNGFGRNIPTLLVFLDFLCVPLLVFFPSIFLTGRCSIHRLSRILLLF